MIFWSRRALMWAASLWFAALIATNAFYFELLECFGALAWAVFALPLIVTGAVLAIMAMVQTTSESTRVLGIAVLVFLLCAAGLTGYTNFCMELGVMSRLFRCERVYLQQIDELERGLPPRGSGSCGREPRIEPGPPMRVAFPWGGRGDEGYGVIFDPSGSTAGSGQGADSLRRWVADVFGGAALGVGHLRGSWYFYWFRRDVDSRRTSAPAGLERSAFHRRFRV